MMKRTRREDRPADISPFLHSIHRRGHRRTTKGVAQLRDQEVAPPPHMVTTRFGNTRKNADQYHELPLKPKYNVQVVRTANGTVAPGLGDGVIHLTVQTARKQAR